MIIEVVERDVYGTPRLYPVNETAKALAKLLRSKCLTIDNLRDAQALGLSVSVVWANELAADLAKLDRLKAKGNA